MSEGIDPSNTSWEFASEIEEWEAHMIGKIQRLLKRDFGDDDDPFGDVSKEAIEGKTIRATYMGPHRFGDHLSGVPEGVPEDLEGVQVTEWRLRYTDAQHLEIGPSEESEEDGQPLKVDGGGAGELFRGRIYARPGAGTTVLFAVAAMWTNGLQIGERRMSAADRGKLYQEFHELLDYALSNMPDLQATPEGDEDIEIDVRADILERLERVQDELRGGTYHVDLPVFTVEVEDDAPVPRPETEEMDPDPFGGGAADILSNVFTFRANRALMEADGEPAPTYKGEWGQDSTGHPIRVEQLGNPYEGRATFRVQAFGEPDPAAVEASMGWKMLDRIEMDTVWLNLLLLSYASATHRRGERPTIRIARRTVEKVFGYTNDNYTMEERAKKIRRHVEALQSIFVQFQNVRRHGDKLHFKGDMAGGAPLWNLRMVAEGEKDLFTGQTVADWHLEAREGLWATEFLHNHGDQFTPLPKEWFKKIDRRGSRNYAQRLAAYLLFQFRINAKNGARVKRRAATLLEVCGEDMEETRDTRRRSELKRCLSKALDTLDRDYGIEVHADRVHMDQTSGMSFNTWKNRTVEFAPPASIEGRIFQSGDGDPPPLPDVAGDWTPEQIRHLRTEIIGETQPEFGARMDVSKQYISQLERGTSDPSTRVRKRLDALHSRYS